MAYWLSKFIVILLQPGFSGQAFWDGDILGGVI